MSTYLTDYQVTKEVFAELADSRSRLLSLVLSLDSKHAPALGVMLRRIVLHGPLVAEQLKLMAPQKQLLPRRSR